MAADRAWRGIGDSRLGVIGVAAVLALAVAGVLAFELVSLRELETSSVSSNRAVQAVTATSQAQVLVLDLETRLRGYALTRRRQFRRSFERERARLPAQERRIARLIEAEHEPLGLVGGMEGAIAAYLNDYAEPLVRAVAHGLPIPRTAAAVNVGRARVDAMRVQFGALLVAEQRYARERRTAASRVAHRAELAGIGGLAGLLVLLTLSGVYLTHLVGRERRAADREHEIARTLQQSLLPEDLPDVPGLALAARFRPAGGYVVGGDFYDVFPTRGGWIAVIGDIAGKGPQAARLTAVARYTLRNEAVHERHPSRLLRSANRSLRSLGDELPLCTLACCALQPVARDFELEVASAGHPLPLLLRADGACVEVGARGTILGLVDEPDLGEDVVRLAPADSLILYTDGLTDAHAPQRLITPAEIAAELSGLAGRTPAEIARALERMAGELPTARDDLAILVLQNTA